MRRRHLAAACAGLGLVPALASATLQGRDLDGNAANGYEAYYDTVLDVSWSADANLFATRINALATSAERQAFIDGLIAASPTVAGHALVRADFLPNQDYTSSGALRWWGAMAFAASANLGGIGGWRLPTMVDVGNDGCNFAYSGTDCGWQSLRSGELATMYYDNLQRPSARGPNGENRPAFGIPNQTALPIPGTADGVVRNLKSNSYWYGVSYQPDGNYAWSFYNTGGEQSAELKNGQFAINHAWLVHDGDVAVVPEPASALLLMGGLATLATTRRRSRRIG